MFRKTLFLITALLFSSCAFAKDYGDINALGQFKLKGTTCLGVSSDEIFHDTNCDGSKGVGENFIDQTGGGGGGTPAGSTGQVQYNNAGSFGAITGATTDGTTLTLVAPVLGTPASATLTNATGLPISTGVSGLGTGVATFLATPSSANLASALTNETGSGSVVLATSPTLVTPALGTPSALVLTNATGLPLTTGVTGTLAATNGGTGLTSATDDAIVTGNGTIWQAKIMPDCQDSGGNHANYNASTNTWTCGTSSSSSAAASALTGTTLASNVVNSSLTSVGTITSGTWNGTTIDYTRGGTGLTSAADDTVMVGSGIGWAAKTLSDCTGAGKAVTYDASTNSFSCNTITASGVNWSSITGIASSANWADTTAGYLPVTAVNWSNMQNLASQTINWANIDMYAKSINTIGSTAHIQGYDSSGINWVSLDWPATNTKGNINWALPFTTTSGTLAPMPRTNTVASSATPSINVDITDEFTITALATAITSMTTNLTGTPINGQRLIIRILDNGTARAITWGASFAARGAALPTTTVLSKYLYVTFIYNSTAAVWDCVSVVQEQ